MPPREEQYIAEALEHAATQLLKGSSRFGNDGSGCSSRGSSKSKRRKDRGRRTMIRIRVVETVRRGNGQGEKAATCEQDEFWATMMPRSQIKFGGNAE